MKSIDLRVGEGVEERVVEAVGSCLSATFGLEVRRGGLFREPPEALDEGRNQFSSTKLLQSLGGETSDNTHRMLGITGHDIFIPMLTFVFGQAQLGGRVALVSLARLRQEFYRIPADPMLFLERACKESLHEVGHTFGLTHCRNRACAMALSTTIQHVDLKLAGFCTSCATLLREGEGLLEVRPLKGFRLEDDL